MGEGLRSLVRAWRKLNGVPRSELADRLGVDESTVWRWEAGKTDPQSEILEELRPLLSSLPRLQLLDSTHPAHERSADRGA